MQPRIARQLVHDETSSSQTGADSAVDDKSVELSDANGVGNDRCDADAVDLGTPEFVVGEPALELDVGEEVVLGEMLTLDTVGIGTVALVRVLDVVVVVVLVVVLVLVLVVVVLVVVVPTRPDGTLE